MANSIQNLQLSDSRDIHIFYAFLDRSQESIATAKGILSSEEIEQAARFVKVNDGERFIIAHAILRQILSVYLKKLASDIQFDRNAYGKPFIKDDADLFFNMSHSDDVAFYAVRYGKTVGIDVEKLKAIDDTPRMRDIAERFFSPLEVDQLNGLPASAYAQGFYRMWVLKESYLKAIGEGLSFPLARFSVDIASEDGRLLAVDGDQEVAASWHVQHVACPQGYLAALAGPGPVDNVQIYPL